MTFGLWNFWFNARAVKSARTKINISVMNEVVFAIVAYSINYGMNCVRHRFLLLVLKSSSLFPARSILCRLFEYTNALFFSIVFPLLARPHVIMVLVSADGLSWASWARESPGVAVAGPQAAGPR